MSKDTPEVGDVWKYKNGMRVLVMYIEDNQITAFTVSKHDSWCGTFEIEKFMQTHTYLGKSKASIEQLFEVENKDA